MPIRFLIHIPQQDVRGIASAIQAAQILGERANCDAVICVPNKKDAPHIALNEIIPHAQIKRMLKGQHLLLGKVKFWMESIATLKSYGQHGVIIALYTPTKDMKKIDSMTNCKAIIFVPWMQKEADEWQSRWSPALIPAKQGEGQK